MPAHWLLKSEPEEWSWEDQVKKGVESWDGVRNALAQKNMRAMKCGDLCFFYHSGKQKAVVGIVSVCKEIYPDPSDETGKWGMVDVKAERPLVQPVTLGEMKADPTFVDLILIRQSRLSVVPLEEKHWDRINELGSVKREEEPKKPRKRAKKDKGTELEPEVGVRATSEVVDEGVEGVVVMDSTKIEEETEKDDNKGGPKGRKPRKRKAVESTGQVLDVDEKSRKERTSGSKVVNKQVEKSATSTEGDASLRRSGRSQEDPRPSCL
ncbi:hypothetical protein KFL_003200040 [Klebsormidium nitens]|uniref:EVE domain-containing protein n=1 Tax=Klebsormidium nitens TaxID=105231 RepID=A0A1Y1IAD0_KLENI|nr:hypothetical protein KFL_003200040 [Klebsormidium nitens]|eukprot:GAQ86912.1 hypothetical protein KFL_003200040 [Klebsormidium nitens]